MMRLNPILSQKIIKTLLWILTGSTIGILFFIIIYIFIKGLPQLSWTFLSTNPVDMGRSGGILATIVSTVYLIGIALFFATPLGLGTAIYLTEYTREGLITKIIRFGTESLAGIPSIILGLFGFAIFVIAFGWGWSLLSGGLTLSAMLLPTIIRTSEDSLLSVPQEYREVAFSLGVGKWKTITRVFLPAALPGIMTGIVLSIARSVGETAVIIFTAGSSLRFPSSIFESGRTLAVPFYILAREGISMPMAYGTAAILVLLILIINISAYMTMRFLMKRY